MFLLSFFDIVPCTRYGGENDFKELKVSISTPFKL
nr:MAG TPA: hypothetical protein [Caudoviricetes sp.]